MIKFVQLFKLHNFGLYTFFRVSAKTPKHDESHVVRHVSKTCAEILAETQKVVNVKVVQLDELNKLSLGGRPSL